MSPENAQVIAIQALGWIAAHEELGPLFLGSTGRCVDDLRTRATDAAVPAAVLDVVTMDDAWVVPFCDAHALKYEEPLAARYALPGAEMVHWT